MTNAGRGVASTRTVVAAIAVARTPALIIERLGDRTLIYARLADGEDVIAEDEGGSEVRIGDRVSLRIDGAAAHLFPPDGTGHHAEPQS